jgi:hypothetical protein
MKNNKASETFGTHGRTKYAYKMLFRYVNKTP